MKKILVIGECMMELKAIDANTMAKSFAGDVYNTAVYAKRWFSDVDVSFFTAIGTDVISQQFELTCESEGISCQSMLRSDTRHLGLYAISTDEEGERSFTYWRNQSAATQMMLLLQQNEINTAGIDIAYFSGISLSILSVESKALLIEYIEKLKNEGAQIAFDPNYRAHMWENKEQAVYWMEKAYALSDIVLPGIDDHNDLFGHQSAEEISEYFNQYNISEMVIKCGTKGVYAFNADKNAFHLPFSPAVTQIDSTAAGDSFAGTYLAARLKGDKIDEAVAYAAEVAKFVIQHHGAIVKQSAFTKFISTYQK